MPALLLLAAVVVVGFEKFAEWQYGSLSAVGLLLIAVGVKAKSPTCAGIGAVVIAMQVTGPTA